ncbi:hypothetical protein SALWKB2_2039 [Snodgrassella alvi wkB2]|nr:hypothetical protein SALWKB2_2039 [Snodgrassella alvi wkB2]
MAEELLIYLVISQINESTTVDAVVLFYFSILFFKTYKHLF